MKLMKAIVVAGVMILCAGTALGETVIREVPLKWKDVATLDGEEVFANLCAVCHGAGGKGDGPAVSALEIAVPDLTVLAARNDGVFPGKQVENVIYGRIRIGAHGKSPMPYWGEHFMYLRTGVSGIPRRQYMWERIHTLSAHIESLQVH
jgi:mono/diheme cytochrome c family protein